MKPDLTCTQLKQILRYNPKTGIFTWLCAPRRGVGINAIAGYTDKRGYVFIGINKRLHLAHRLAWLYMTGEWPHGEIDHRNSRKSDNRFANLRDVSHSLNQQNLTGPQKNNSAGFLGVSPKRGRWRARIQIGKKYLQIGTFDSPEEAHAAYTEAKRTLHEGCTL